VKVRRGREPQPEVSAPSGPQRSNQLALLRARLDLPMTRKVHGMMEGRHRSTLHGHGQDFDDLSRYSPGDDIGDIDWRSSARAGVPLIQRYVHDTTITVALAVDTGREMSAVARGGQTKAEVVMEFARLVALLAYDGADRLMLIGADSQRSFFAPARYGQAHTEFLLRRLEQVWSADAPPSDVPALLTRVGRTMTRRGLVVLITDESHPDVDSDLGEGEGPEAQALRRLRARHEVMVTTVHDADPRSGPDLEDGWLAPPVLHTTAGLDDAVAQAVARRAARRTRELRRIGALAISAGHTEDVLPAFARALRADRAGR